jgi:hypothetical protein
LGRRGFERDHGVGGAGGDRRVQGRLGGTGAAETACVAVECGRGDFDVGFARGVGEDGFVFDDCGLE